ncbi:MAG: hypothetical protein AB7P69_08395 [Candidatus Binatia bacterium]
MQISGIRLDTLGSRSGSSGVIVEALPVGGNAPELLPAQRLTATVLERNGQQAVIDLKGTQLTLTAQPGWKPGMELSVQVAQVVPKLLLEVTPQLAKTLSQLPPLAIGQEVEAEVVEELSNGSVLVSIEGTLLEAETPATLLPGRLFAARVEQLRPQIVLHLLPGTEEKGEIDPAPDMQAEAIRLLRTNITDRTASAESLTTLTQELASFVEHPPQDAVPPSIMKLHSLMKTLLPEHAPPTAEHLAAFVRDGGLHYEAKLLRLAESTPQALAQVAEEDLKGLLLQALKDLATAQGKPDLTEPSQDSFPSQDIAASLAHHLDHIESQQAVNLLAQAKGEPYQLQIPLFTGQGMTTAFLSIESEGQGNGETETQRHGEKGKGYNILFMLDLEGFGKTRIDARIGEKSLWVAFYVDQNSSIALLQREFPAFRETIQAFGYNEVLLVAKPLGQIPPEKREKFDSLTVGVPLSVHLLDVKA